MVKLIIAGGRDFTNSSFLSSKVSEFLFDLDKSKLEIVGGGAKGADFLGKKYAFESGIPYKPFEADWGKWGKMAGPRRNLEMAEYGTHLIAFWDGTSRGTKNMIDNARDLGLQVQVYYYKTVTKFNSSLKTEYLFCEPLEF